VNYVIILLSAMDIYIIRRTFADQESPKAGASVGLSKGRFDSSKSSVDGTSLCWPHYLVLSRTGYRNVSQPWDAVTGKGMSMHIMKIHQELKA